jgi:hypothetical protein
VARVNAGPGLPPMPWMNVARTTDSDLRTVYRFIRSLGAAGERAPLAVAPGLESSRSYIPFVPTMPSGGAR